MSKRRQRANLTAFVIGLFATVVVLGLYLAGWLDWVELETLDLRFRHANAMPEDERIVCIDIDDTALKTVGRWPWPRDVQAGVISILAEVGAEALLFDITLGEAEPVRSITPRHADLEIDPLELSAQGTLLAFPDQEIRTAIADAHNVCLAFDFRARDILSAPGFREVVALAGRDELGAARQRVAELWGHSAATEEPNWPLRWARIVAALEPAPLKSAQALTSDVGDFVASPEAQLDACRQVVLRWWIQAWLDDEPQRWAQRGDVLFDTLYRELLESAGGAGARHWEVTALALRDVLGYWATVGPGLLPVERVAAAARPVDAISPVYYLHARAARRCGFVVFEPDADGIVRQMRLLAQHDGRVLPQLAFAVAFDALGLEPEDVSAVPGRLTLQRHDGAPPTVIQLDRDGRTLIPWVAERDWTKQFGRHVPVGAVWEVYDRRLSIRHNEELIAAGMDSVLEAGLLGDHWQYLDDLNRRLELDSELRLARYRDETGSVAEIRGWMRQYDELLADGRQAVRVALATVENASPEQEATLREIERAFAANDEYRTEIVHSLERLRGRVAGRICLLGYTATALADMKPIPTHPRAPGVVAHANLLNGLLTGRTVGWAPQALNVLLAALCGILASAVSVVRSPREAGLWVAGLLIAFVGVAGWWAFYAYSYWIAVTPTVGALLLSYLSIGVYRYVFLDRERRQLTTALSQYTSATLARQMAEDAELCQRAESRDVTAMFTDLRGFTSISERIGAERTQKVLNLCLGRSTEIMLSYEAMINKFIGDGVFAFWNPVIHTQPDHAERACRTALDLLAGLRDLAAEQHHAGGDDVFGELVMRIGVASGHAVVGPCGSEQKYDYTCIGDTVNVAARLESANKFYGTSILVSHGTREQVGDTFEFRPLGGVQVKGKQQAIPIYELLGRAGEVADELCEYAADFGRAITRFQQRDWQAAREHVEKCARTRPDDLAAQRYLQALEQFSAQPPADDWNGAIELAEK